MKSKQETILQAAYDLLASGNYQNMTTVRIAREAGVAEGTLYRYFKNKRQMLFQVIVYYSEKIMDQVFTKVSEQKPFQENLDYFAEEFLKSLDKDMPFYRILYKAFSELDDEEIFPVLRNFFLSNLDRIKNVFIWARNRGEINIADEELDLIVQNLWGMADGYMKRVILNVNLPVKRSDLDFSINIIKSALIGGVPC